MPRSFTTGLLAVLAAAAVVAAIRFILPYAAPFFFACLLAALIDAPVNRLERAGLARGPAVLLVLGLLTLSCTGAAALLVVELAQDASRLAEQLPRLAVLLSAGMAELADLVGRFGAGLPGPVQQALLSSTARLVQTLELVIRSFFAALAGLPTMMAGLAVTMLATYFLARDGRKLAAAAVATLPGHWQRRTTRLNQAIFSGVVGFVRAQTLLIALSGLLSTAVLLAFGVPYAWLLGVAAGVLDLLPVVGPSGVFIPLIAWLWVGGMKAQATGMAAAWGAVLLLRQLAEPVVVGTKAGLHPLTTLVAVYAGVRAWGLAGIFLGPLLAVCGKALWLGAVQPLWRDGSR